MTTEQPDRIGPYQITRELVLAQHQTGDSAAAVQTKQHALSLMQSPDAVSEQHDRLAEYEAALGAEPDGADGDQERIPARGPGGVPRQNRDRFRAPPGLAASTDRGDPVC